MYASEAVAGDFIVTSEISGFYKLSPAARLEKIAEIAKLSKEEQAVLSKEGGLPMETANRMVENVIGFMPLPLGIATNFFVNGKEYLVPMAIEEPSVIAAASNGAKLARSSGGFKASMGKQIMIGQVQIVGVKDAKGACEKLNAKKNEWVKTGNENCASLVQFGGGVREFSARGISTARGEMVIAEYLVDVQDAMGANSINTVLEATAPKIAAEIGGKVRLRILSNLAVHRIAKASAVWKKEEIGEEAVEGVLDAYEFAANDVYRCATHNKGIHNGMDAVAVATGNDWRALEAGAHAYAALNGYKPLTKFWKNKNGDLEGSIEVPLAIGTVGGATKTHPVAQMCMKILGTKGVAELGCVMASVGLAQNFAALRALSTEGIQKGHMRLHAANIAVMAGAKGEEIEEVAKKMAEGKDVSLANAKKILEGMKKR
ncbi:3-hydroxy-3-methylglutaryl-coenzyme A reductase [Candidatus Anstonella stagnisolia]|nr:3-hydroxy-3-methylglutaryl-coenzyme A reductase [Candidatus Anstonella stagnisolia]